MSATVHVEVTVNGEPREADVEARACSSTGCATSSA